MRRDRPVRDRTRSHPSFAKALTPIPIAVTVSDLAQYHVRSDGLGEYVNGQQTVTAQIDGFGNLLVTVATADPPARMLTFDYSAPADPLNPFPATATGARWFKIKSNKTNNGNPAIGAMNLNTSYCYNVTLAHGDGITQYQDGFNQALNGQATYVTIVRTSSTTWTMATNPACSGTRAPKASPNHQLSHDLLTYQRIAPETRSESQSPFRTPSRRNVAHAPPGTAAVRAQRPSRPGTAR